MNNNISSTKRNTHVDIMKAIAILCVIIGHLQFTPMWLNRLIMSFHMPLFFVISGIFFKNDKYSIKKDFKKLIFPYIFTGLLIFIIECLMSPSMWRQTAKEVLFQMILASGSRHHDCFPDILIPSIRVLWFLMALFWARFFFQLVLSIFQKEKSRTIACLLLSIIGMIVDNRLLYSPLALNQALLVLIFLQIGHISNRFNLTKWKCAVLLIMWIYPAAFYTIDLCRAHLDGVLYPITVIGSIGGVLLISFISKLIAQKEITSRPIACLGQITLPIMCYHAIIHHGKFFYQYNSIVTTILWLGIPIILAIFTNRIPILNKIYNTPTNILSSCRKLQS